MMGNTMSLVKRSTSLLPYRSMTQLGMAVRARGEVRSPRAGARPLAQRSARPPAAPHDSMAGAAGPGWAEPRDRDRDKGRDRDKDRNGARSLPRPQRSAPAAPAANGQPPSWPPCQWCRGVLRQDGGLRSLRREKSLGRSAGVRRWRRAGRAMLRASIRQVSGVCPPAGDAEERGGGVEERGGFAR